MSQNIPSGSYAVMAQRVEAHDSLDLFPTPPWATRALCEWLTGYGSLRGAVCWEPACGLGDMVRPLLEYFKDVWEGDIHNYGQKETCDFLFCPPRKADWIITNPPFRLASEFAEEALRRATTGVALLVRTAFLESADRYERLFRDNWPSDILQFVERVPMHKGRLDRHGSTATAYCWIVWRIGHRFTHPLFRWLPPCRKRLERDSDYAPPLPFQFHKRSRNRVRDDGSGMSLSQ